MTLDEFNQLPTNEALTVLESCCAATGWSEPVVAGRPYADFAALTSASDQSWAQTDEDDWLLAFTAHPQIGNVETLRAKYANTKTLAAGEQSSVQQADEDVLQALAAGNQQYLDQNGFIFIVCATGKSAAEMLELLTARLSNNREQELKIGAAEQHKITTLRLRKLFKEAGL